MNEFFETGFFFRSRTDVRKSVENQWKSMEKTSGRSMEKHGEISWKSHGKAGKNNIRNI